MEKEENISLRQQISQMLIIGIKGKKINKNIKELIKEYGIGGIIIYKKNYDTYEEMIKLINDIKELNKNNSPMFIAIDQEGGRVNRLPKEIRNIPAAFQIAKSKDIKLLEESGDIIGEALSESGVNMNFAPVLDIKRFEDMHAIGDRCYGESAKSVTENAIPIMNKMKKRNVISVVKHFPGHGSTIKDSHFFLPKIEYPISKLEKEDMLVFENAIKNGADAIMVGHLKLKEVDSHPASLSKVFITDYLRKKYKFKGLVITDDLKMKAIRMRYSNPQAIRHAINAGADIIVVRTKFENEKSIIAKVEKLVKSGKIDKNRIYESNKRIKEIKQKYNLNNNEVKGCNVKELNERIEKIREIVCK